MQCEYKEKNVIFNQKGQFWNLPTTFYTLRLTEPWKGDSPSSLCPKDDSIWEIAFLFIPTSIISTDLWLEWGELAYICSNFWFWKKFSPTRIDTACQVIYLLLLFEEFSCW